MTSRRSNTHHTTQRAAGQNVPRIDEIVTSLAIGVPPPASVHEDGVRLVDRLDALDTMGAEDVIP